jgi:phosphoesterase RecJ-like protein
MSEIIQAIRAAERVVVASHSNPDGDAVGAILAFRRAMIRLGKKCRAVNSTPVPRGLAFLLEDESEVLTYLPGRDDGILEEADLFVLLDCAALERAGPVGKKMRALRKLMVVIDHHSTNTGFGTINSIHDHASSACELVMDLLERLKLPLTRALALPLYVGIVTDTGDFNYPSTTRCTHEKAGKLLDLGINPYEIHRQLALNRTIEFIRLTGLAIFNTQIGYGGSVAYSVVHHDVYRKFTPGVDELAMLPPYLLSIDGVEVGALFLEYEPNRILVELRSQGLVNAATVARKFGGGGHTGAAGMRMEGEMADAVFRVLTQVRKGLISAERKGVTEELRTKMWVRT